MKSLLSLAILVALKLGCLLPIASPTTAQAETKYLEIPASDAGLLGGGPIRRYDWFRKLWKEKRTGWATRIKQDQEGLVFFGDSITQGWGDDFKGLFPGVKAINRGISGDTTRGMLVRLFGDVLVLNPTGVVLLMGTNDLEEGAAPKVIATNVRLILNQLKDHDPDMPVILCKVFPSSIGAKRPARKIKEINKLLAEVGMEHPQVTVLDTWTLFANADGNAKKEEFPDFLHPNDAGYAKWKSALWPILATQGHVDREPDTFTNEEGFVSLFNGHDLTGWGFREPNTLEPLETFDGEERSSDGRYIVKNGRLVVTTPNEGRKTAQLWTTREFANDFVLRLEFRATPNADSGVFARGRQLQCRDYILAGPYKTLKRYKPQEWNSLQLIVRDGVLRATCNGEWLGEPMKLPETGPLGLEGDRGQMEYRRIRIREEAKEVEEVEGGDVEES